MGMLRGKLLAETAAIVAAIVAAKFAIQHSQLEFIALSTLFTSIIAGGVFILSIILSGVISDFKESEKLPADIATEGNAIEGDVAATLIAEGRNSELLVVGARGRGGFAGMLLGSVGTDLLREAKAPLAIVRH